MSFENLSLEEKALLLVTLGAFLAAVYIGSHVISGVFTGLLSSIGVFLLFIKLKDFLPSLYVWLLDKPLWLDLILSGLAVWMVASNSVVGIIAGASGAIFSSLATTVLTKSRLGLVVRN